MSECSYHGNIATGQGGALYLQEVSPITITRTDFEHNQAVVGGGALYLTEHSLADITDAAFKSNTAASGGEDAAHGGALLPLLGAVGGSELVPEPRSPAEAKAC